VLNLTVRMVPLVADVAAHPHLSIHFAVIGLAKVDLVAVVALLVVLVTLVAQITETDLLVVHVLEFDLSKLRLLDLLRGHRRLVV